MKLPPQDSFARFLLESLTISLILLFYCMAFALTAKHKTHVKYVPQAQQFPIDEVAAVYITTNLVNQECTCGWCDASRGIAIPEHMNRIGYDLRIEVVTNYLPIVYHYPEPCEGIPYSLTDPMAPLLPPDSEPPSPDAPVYSELH